MLVFLILDGVRCMSAPASGLPPPTSSSNGNGNGESLHASLGSRLFSTGQDLAEGAEKIADTATNLKNQTVEVLVQGSDKATKIAKDFVRYGETFYKRFVLNGTFINFSIQIDS